MHPMLAALFAAAVATAPAPLPPVGDWLPLDPANTLVVDTSKGRYIVELRPDLAPLHVARMKVLARQGYYTGARFYRVIKGFMAQTGKLIQPTLPNLKDEFSFARTPAMSFTAVGPDGQGFIGASPVQIDPATGRGFVFFCPGIASTAHGDPPNTGNNQVFFMRGRGGPSIEAHFTAWGRVVQGQEVVEAIEDGQPPPKPDTITRLRVMADMPAAERPKLQVMDTRGPAFAALVDGVMKERTTAYHPCDVTVPVKEG
jgi:peptidylprolyl isomerase